MENIKDWCISRQLWWGHRIPAWYFGSDENDFVVAKTLEEAIEKATAKSGRTITESDLRQDEDVLDTWFSSWLWPISVFNGLTDPENEEIKYYYPTNDLVTAPEIMFFWVARMMMMGEHFQGQLPFKDIYMHALVRDETGAKMSKSKGNVIDPLDMVEEHSADIIRFTLAYLAVQGRDIKLGAKNLEQFRNFTNKLYNATNYLQLNVETFPELKDIEVKTRSYK